MTLGGMAAAAAQSQHRLIVVVAWPNDPRVTQQHAALAQHEAAMRERDVVVQDMTPDEASLDRSEWGVNKRADFTVLLVGKDGRVKLRREQPVAASEITALIDTMPMRQNEMRC